jgi:DNA-binding YbaB/EbfC family protein
MFDPKKLFDMIKNAGEMQKNMTEKLKQYKATGEAAGGMVRVEMNGHFEVEAITIDESLLKEDKAFVEDLIKAAVNSATAQLRSNMADYFKSVAGKLWL